MNHERIKLSDTGMSALMKIAEGNPGAVRACIEMMQRSPEIDPDSALGSIAPLLSLDTHSIYGSRIWMLYQDACRGNVVHVLVLLRSVQLGITPERTLNAAIDNRGDGLDMDAILADVRERLPRFGATAAEPVSQSREA
jgi:hypothetical protein